MYNADGKNLTILVIDDTPANLSLISNILKKSCQYNIVCASEAEAALKLIDTSTDLIILDLILPGMNAMEFLKIIRSNENFKEIPVIIYSVNEKSKNELSELFNSGANDYLKEPFLEQELLERVKVQLNNKMLTNQLKELNSVLKNELEEYKKLLIISSDYTDKLEKTLTEKIKAVNREKNNEEFVITEDEIDAELKKQYQTERNSLRLENEKFKKKIADLDIVFSTIVSHDTLIEDQLAVKLDEANKTSMTDPLTGIFNRNKMNEAMEKEILNAKKLNRKLSVIMIDIDHFKNINDEFGHDIGDSVLIGLTKLIKKNLEKNTFFARWGGEEFLILLPNTKKKDAIQIAEELRFLIEMRNGYLSKPITCSFGVTQYIPNENKKKFFKRVDNSLYDAKDSGRNIVKYR